MAYVFKEAEMFTNLAFLITAPSPEAAVDFIIANAENANVADLFTVIKGGLPVGATGIPLTLQNIHEELKRVADTEIELELTRESEDAEGRTTTLQAKGRSVI
jgi:hypothetical protein